MFVLLDHVTEKTDLELTQSYEQADGDQVEQRSRYVTAKPCYIRLGKLRGTVNQ